MHRHGDGNGSRFVRDQLRKQLRRDPVLDPVVIRVQHADDRLLDGLRCNSNGVDHVIVRTVEGKRSRMLAVRQLQNVNRLVKCHS